MWCGLRIADETMAHPCQSRWAWLCLGRTRGKCPRLGSRSGTRRQPVTWLASDIQAKAARLCGTRWLGAGGGGRVIGGQDVNATGESALTSVPTGPAPPMTMVFASRRRCCSWAAGPREPHQRRAAKEWKGAREERQKSARAHKQSGKRVEGCTRRAGRKGERAVYDAEVHAPSSW